MAMKVGAERTSPLGSANPTFGFLAEDFQYFPSDAFFERKQEEIPGCKAETALTTPINSEITSTSIGRLFFMTPRMSL